MTIRKRSRVQVGACPGTNRVPSNRRLNSVFFLTTDRFDITKSWKQTRGDLLNMDDEGEEDYCLFLQAWPQVRVVMVMGMKDHVGGQSQRHIY
jgi:hypothetical protein